MRIIKTASGVLGVVALGVFATYWFELDNLMIRKAEPMLRGLADMKKKVAAEQKAQNG